MEKNNSENILGRKVFFLHPPAFIQNQLAGELAQDEFEVYLAKDEAKLRRLLPKYPDSIVFACVSEALKEKAWEEWIGQVMGAEETKTVDIGILSAQNDENLRRKYTGQLKVPCGYTVLKSSAATVVKELTDILNAVNAKGRRKYVRAFMNEGANTTVNFPFNGNFVKGVINDISVVGFSCSLADNIEIAKNTHFDDIQLRLQSQLIKAEGILFGSRKEAGKTAYVVLFTQRTSPDVKAKIRKYIQSNLQAKMDSELK